MSAVAAPAPPETAAPPSEPEIIAKLQQTISPSRLTLFLQCRLKFWFRYVARLPKPKSAALHVGGTAHAVLKAWNKSRWRNAPLTLKQLHDEYAKAWADQTDEPVKWEPGEEDDERITGWRLVETYIRESKIPAELRPDAVEVPVEADAAIASIKALLLQTPEREAQAKLQAALTKWTNARAFAVQKQAMAPARPAAQPKPSRTLEVDGIKYEQFTLTSFDGVNVGIDHAAGVARIQAIKLKPEQIVALNQTSSSVRIDLGKTAGAITASSGSNAAGERQQRSPHSGQPTTPRGAFGDATPNGDSLPSRSGFMPDVRLPAQSDSSNAADDEQRQELRDVLYKMAGIEIDSSARARLSPEERAVREVTDLAKTGVFFMGLGLGQEARKSEKQIPDGLQQNPRTGRREACERS